MQLVIAELGFVQHLMQLVIAELGFVPLIVPVCINQTCTERELQNLP